MITLITGATRSGKSEWAEILAGRSQQSVIYIATARADSKDVEWQARLSKHKQRRPLTWQTLEVPYILAETIRQAQPHEYLLIDSLGTWLVNFLDSDELSWERTTIEFLDAIKLCRSDLTIVSEEVGWGVVPAYESGRRFRDRLGHLSRQLGAIADAVYLVTGGHAVNLTTIAERLP